MDAYYFIKAERIDQQIGKFMKRIFLDSYISRNLGDDLFIKVICERYPEHQFYVWAAKEDAEVFRDLKNLTCFAPVLPAEHDTYRRALNKLLSYFHIPKLQLIRFFHRHQFDIYIAYGGSIYMQTTKHAWINKVRDQTYIMGRHEKNLALGCNFGPFFTKDFVEKHQEMFAEMTDVCFRDRYSYKLFEELSNVRTASDVVFNLKYERVQTENYIVVSVMSLDKTDAPSQYRDVYESQLVDLVRELLKRGYRIRLMSFCSSQGDMKSIQRMLERLQESEERVSPMEYTSIDEALRVLAGASGIVATRFHAMVLAMLMEKPVLPLVYSKKMLHVLKDSGFDGYYLEIEDIGELDFEKAVLELQKTRKISEAYMKEAEKQFQVLDQLLG